MKKINILLTLIIIFLITPLYAEKIYYIDSRNGSDSNNGLSTSSAWKTIGKINDSWGAIQTGDNILFKRGETYTDSSLSIKKGGSSSNPMIIGAYGSGEKPIIDGGPNSIKGGINCYSPNLSYIVIQDLMIKNIKAGQGVDFGADYLSHISISRVEIDNNTYGNGILLYKIDTYLIEDCILSNCANSGIAIIGSPTYAITNGIIRNNTVHDIKSNDGITLHKDGSGNNLGQNHEILNNMLYSCAEEGLDITSGDNIILRKNETFNNLNGGISVGSGASNVWIDKHFSHDEKNVGIIIGLSSKVKLTNSIIYNSWYHHLTVINCAGFQCYNNTLVFGSNSTGSMVDISENSRDLVFINNIFSSLKAGFPSRIIRYLSGASPSNTNSSFDYNVYWVSNPADDRMWWDGTTLFTFSGWKSTCRQDSQSLFKDPKFVSSSNGNFRLQALSPCIDAGIDINLQSDFDGVTIPQGWRPDIGAFEYLVTATVTASASASPTSGQAPLSVNFTGSASGGTSPYTYSWNFGDSQSSTAQNPSHTYSSAGVYTANLTVKDSTNASDTSSLTINVTTASSPLAASASASPTSGQAPLSVNFTGSASGGISPYTYSWNFGDSQSSTAQNPSHTYSSPGVYTANLTVKDGRNASDTSSLTINVTTSSSSLAASASASPTSGQAPLSVNFTGSASGGTPPYSYRWNFGDGQSSTAQNPAHDYSNSGNFIAILTVTDSKSIRDDASLSITVVSPGSGTFQLSIFSATGTPAPGQGGTTDPSPGNHDYSAGTTVQIKSLTNNDYRFSRWTGDVGAGPSYQGTIGIVMNKAKSVSASFCTKCGDVTGDLAISPADAQKTFDLYLGKIQNPTFCELENADVNGSGTPSEPQITPADAQAIFKKYLKKGVLPSDCSGISRTAERKIFLESSPPGEVRVTFSDQPMSQNDNLLVPIIVDSSSPISAFGLDLLFPSEDLVFIGVEKTDFSEAFYQLGAHESSPGFIRVGGYASQPVSAVGSNVLMTLVFRVVGQPQASGSISIINKYDDLRNAQVDNRMINRESQREARPTHAIKGFGTNRKRHDF